MADDQYRRLSCVDCHVSITAVPGSRGRPRKRCFDCSPSQIGLPTAPRPRVDRTCEAPGCGRLFTTIGGQGSGRFCGRVCRNRVSNRARQEAARDRSSRACRFCGVVFEPGYGDLRQAYCSARCQAAMRNARTSGNSHLRRALKRGVEFQRFDKTAVFARDRWRCQLCGVKTPRSLQGTRHTRAPELDHIVTFAAGGAHTPQNTQCACRRCNRKKGGRPLGQLHLQLI